MFRPLYEISNDYQRVLDSFLDKEIIDISDETELDKLNDDIEKKAINVASYIRNIEIESAAIDDAIKKMKERKERLDRKVEFLKDYLKYNLEKCDKKEVKSPFFDIKVKQNPPKVLVIDESLIPEMYFKVITTRKIDLSMLSKALKNDTFITGAELEKRTRIEIK